MKMVSAAKLKRAQDAITQIRPYANKLKELLENVSGSVDASENVYARKSNNKTVLVLAISSNRGLAGAFNSNIIKKTNSLIQNDYKGAEVTVLPIGKKVTDAFKRTKYYISGQDLPHHAGNLYDKITYETVSPVIEKVIQAYLNKEFDKVVVVYNQFRNAAVQVATEEQLLPVLPAKTEGKSNNTDYIFEPGKEFMVNELIPRSVKTQFYKALLDSVASEHGARMTAMHKATDNAKAMQKELKIMYNKARQASITKEILEIVGGAEALKG
jgi:F-type H+-transporting ATPase subunit gamma